MEQWFAIFQFIPLKILLSNHESLPTVTNAFPYRSAKKVDSDFLVKVQTVLTIVKVITALFFEIFDQKSGKIGDEHNQYGQFHSYKIRLCNLFKKRTNAFPYNFHRTVCFWLFSPRRGICIFSLEVYCRKAIRRLSPSSIVAIRSNRTYSLTSCLWKSNIWI